MLTIILKYPCILNICSQNSTFYLQPENSGRIARFFVANMLNNIIEIIGDNCLDLSKEVIKKTSKAIILTNIHTNCNLFMLSPMIVLIDQKVIFF